MIYQNYRGDFLIVEKFYRDRQKQEQVPVPEHVRVNYFTGRREGVFVAERNGDWCRSCEVSDDGMSLLVYVPLSRVPIGRGELMKVVTEISEDVNFPSGEKYVPVPQKTGIILYDGISDGSGEVLSESVLSLVLHGYSAYELAVQHGYEGTEEEWLESCSPDLTGIEKSIAKLMDEVFPLSFGSFAGGGSYEMGTSVVPSISWTLSRKGEEVSPDSATVDGSDDGVADDKKSWTAREPVSSDVSHTVKVSAGATELSRTASWRFLFRKWWGVSGKAELSSDDVLDFPSSQLASGRALSSSSFDCTGGRYVYYVLPEELADGLECWIGGLRNSDLVMTPLEVTNQYGVAHGYMVIRLNEMQTGVLTIEFR